MNPNPNTNTNTNTNTNPYPNPYPYPNPDPNMVGTIKGGHGYNIISDRVDICGTCRSFTPEVRDEP